MSYLSLFGRKQPKFRYTLITDNVTNWVLPHTPRGWEGALINHSRSETYYGMMRSFTVPISYVKDGATLLRQWYYKHGIEANVQLRVEKYNSTTSGWDLIYQGDNDFSQYKDEGSIDGDVVTINVMQGGIQKFVKAYENVKFTIPLNVPQARTINLTPIKLRETASFIFTQYPTQQNDGFLGVQLVSNDQKALIASVQSVPNLPIAPSDFSWATAGTWFYQAQVATRISLKGSGITGDFGYAFGTTVDISIYNQTGTKLYTIYHATGGTITGFNISFDTGIQVNAGDRLFIYVTFSNSGGRINITDGNLSAQYDTISTTDIANGVTGTCLAVTGLYLFQQLMNNMQGLDIQVPVPIQSYLLSQWDGLLFTSGNSIKPFKPTPLYSIDGLIEKTKYFVFVDTVVYNGITHTVGSSFTTNSNTAFTSVDPDAYVMQVDPAPSIIISWKEFFNSLNAILNIGWGVEVIGGVSTSVLEKKSYFYKPNLPAMNVGEVSKFTLSPYLPAMYNSIKVGYTDQTYDQINGVTEFNSYQEYTVPIKQVVKELNLISSIRADSTGRELLRVGLSSTASGSSNTASNNDTWAMYCIPDGGNWKPEPASAFTGVSGLNTNLDNLRISPKENLLRHGDFLAGMCDKLQGEQITFVSGQKNVNLSHINNGVMITENANIDISSLPTPIFLPHECDITIKEPFDALDLIDRYPTGYITFSTDGIDISVFILDCATDINMNKQQQIKGLVTPNNNLANLNR